MIKYRKDGTISSISPPEKHMTDAEGDGPIRYTWEQTAERVYAQEITEGRMSESKVDHPRHYNTGKVEVIDAIEAWSLGFCLGNTVKYVARAGKKFGADDIEDLEKAAWYLSREITRRKSEKRK